ncbi:hypothetical protein FOCG_02566 [Fusarium oxysporum f. sp. radicis-lycopersici 26381]|uniref:Uncharacterized protein n=1 Tax=Fusarium oxysporum Fo47 TaxID=660027 RepID=W9KD81_FUSOX|nr:hypothetical protein FOZG_07278 [Fusarium oxysporum Fo47]EXA00589.1 hypothetical protein FOWG_00766 [Fusarium oxysporum f. sp. lycopersici MN25]EXL59271.1 hypothetical protein FOCG_02566 [Fusarium oxysporum f. sp. radicis-lycopersici 26381]EWZ42311.1 hypothetical protein FOZG_07278 [Fusarium oxysporum Fo47]EXA00590.1 hypothetical protein FOWG_00766 [Fusarium oxysporum f. sp. lycopersici MN25]
MLCYLWCNFPHFHRCESLRLRFRHDGGRGAAKVCQFRGRKSPSAVGACFALHATIYQRLELSSSKRSQENGRYLPRRCSVKRIFCICSSSALHSDLIHTQAISMPWSAKHGCEYGQHRETDTTR